MIQQDLLRSQQAEGTRIFFCEKIPVSVYTDSHKASAEAARQVAALIRKKKEAGQFAVLGLATGSTPLKVYNELIRLHKEEGLSFSNVISFNLDEYYGLGAGSPQSYREFMRQHLFQYIDIDLANCHVPDGQVSTDTIKRHCEEYEQKISSYGGIDLQLLGIGRNGHIGFNEPGSHRNSTTRLITLDTLTRSDAAAAFGGLANVPRKAITMGISTILRSKKILLLAWGENKSGVIKAALEGPVSETVPASFLHEHDDTGFYIDEPAASSLTRITAPWLFDNIEWDKRTLKRAVIQLSLSLDKPVLKLTNTDYNENGLSDLLALFGSAYEINIQVFNLLQQTITGWPGGKPGPSDTKRPERAKPARKRILIFSPHPDDDIISMGGTFQRLADQGHEVHVAYQTSGNIAVADDEALRFIGFVHAFNSLHGLDIEKTTHIYEKGKDFINNKINGEKDIPLIREVKGLIRKGEAYNTCRFVGIPDTRIHYLNMPFYETGSIQKNALSEMDYAIIQQLISAIKPHQVYAAGDLADPHGTHKVCLDAVFESLRRLRNEPYMKNCWVWLYKGAWAEWDIDQVDMAVPMSPGQVLKKRQGIFKHQSQKDGIVFQGSDQREFWQRAEDRNKQTASLYNKLGLAEYEAIEAFARWDF